MVPLMRDYKLLYYVDVGILLIIPCSLQSEVHGTASIKKLLIHTVGVILRRLHHELCFHTSSNVRYNDHSKNCTTSGDSLLFRACIQYYPSAPTKIHCISLDSAEKKSSVPFSCPFLQ
jgi:hypothetical protein